MATDTDRILKLAEIVREADGNHRPAAAVLAEAILSHHGSRWSPAVEPEPKEPTDEELNDLFWKHSCEIGDRGVGLAFEDAPALIREALARWGRPAIQFETNGQA